jgi:stearoyl-CoA desaturase (delta-9 desaturase)
MLCEPSASFVRRIAVIVVAGPFIAFLAATVLLWGKGIDRVQLGILGFMYTISLMGVAVGFHRLFSHHSFQTTTPIRVILAVCGSMAAQGPVLFWTAIHRRHHTHADLPGDPHSPNLEEGRGWRPFVKGLWHAHTGWMFEGQYTDWGRYAPDLLRDSTMFWVNQMYFAWVVLGLMLPAALGGLLTWSWAGALNGFLIGGLVRIFFVHHATWSINSICHTFGSRDHDNADASRNNPWLAIVTLGESWHNNHHTYPAAAIFRQKWYQLDLSGLVIQALGGLGLAWSIKSASSTRAKLSA